MTIPRHIVRHWKLEPGARLVLRATDEGVLLYPRYFLPYSDTSWMHGHADDGDGEDGDGELDDDGYDGGDDNDQDDQDDHDDARSTSERAAAAPETITGEAAPPATAR